MSVSIPVGLRIILIMASVFVLAYVVYSSVKEKMEVRYAILWITWAAVVLLFALLPAALLAHKKTGGMRQKKKTAEAAGS